MQQIIVWAVSYMTTFMPLDTPVGYKDAIETPAERSTRFESIAKDVVDVVYDPSFTPLWTGKDGRARSLMQVLSIMRFEAGGKPGKKGGFLKNVDLGIGKWAYGDGGRSVCLMQINVGSGYVVVDGEQWDRNDLLKDRKKCIRAGIEKMRASFKQCSWLAFDVKLAGYTSGNCYAGHDEAKIRYYGWRDWYLTNPVPNNDDVVLDALKSFKDEHPNPAAFVTFPLK